MDSYGVRIQLCSVAADKKLSNMSVSHSVMSDSLKPHGL